MVLKITKAKCCLLLMQGTAWNEEGQPLPGASVEVWHANTLGNYSFFYKSQSAFNLRRTIITDEQGRYQFYSIVPSGYGCPPNGLVQHLLNQLGRYGVASGTYSLFRDCLRLL